MHEKANACVRHNSTKKPRYRTAIRLRLSVLVAVEGPVDGVVEWV